VAFAPKGRPEALDSVCGAAHTLIIIEISIKMGEKWGHSLQRAARKRSSRCAEHPHFD